jgi:hypothetical protein
MFIAAAAACLVASASSWEGAWGGDPEFIDHTRPFFYVNGFLCTSTRFEPYEFNDFMDFSKKNE